MPTLSTFLAPSLPFLGATGVALATLLASVLVYRLALKPLARWLHRNQPERATRMLARLFPIYLLTSALTAAQAFRGLGGVGGDWWLGALWIPAAVVLVVEGLRLVVVDALLAARTGRAVPKILRDIAFGLIYMMAFLAYLGGTFKVDLAPFLTTSAILSVVIGMALQDTLGNLFAGLAINLDRPFELEDWIQVDGQEGRVVEITWRATKIVTRRHEMVIIPNNALAKTKVLNYHLPTARYAEAVEFDAPYRVPPHRVRAIALAVAAETEHVATEPAPVVQLIRFADSAIHYRTLLWIDDAGRALAVRSHFQERLWYHFQREQIEFPFPVRTVEIEEAGARDAARIRENLRALRHLDVLSCMDGPALEELARKARIIHFGQDERIFSQGDPGGSLFLIKRGRVVLSLDERGGRDTRPFAQLEEGQFFGEMSLLTGEARTASAHAAVDCEFLVLEHRHLAPLLAEHPEFMQRISHTIAERTHSIEQARRVMAHERETAGAGDPIPFAVEEASNEILGRIRAFFRLG